MALLRVRPSTLEGEITAPPSKSYTHRAFSIALLADGWSKISDPLISLDTESTINAVKIFGGKVFSDGARRVKGTSGEIRPSTNLIDVRNSGTTLRIMSAIAALSPNQVRLTGDSSILARPMAPLIEALSKLGAKARCEGPKGRPPVIVGGGLKGGEAELTGAVSSQFVSALLIACPYAQEDVFLTITEELRSRPYVEITLEVLGAAGAKIKKSSDLMEFSIPGRQIFRPIEFSIPGDFSSAAFILGGAAIAGGCVKVKNLDMRGAQGDKRVVEFLRQFGADIKVRGKSIEVLGTGDLTGIEADCGDNPDLVPVLAVLGCVADGRTILTNIPHLRYKETDRLRALTIELRKMGADVEESPDELRIQGVKQLKGASLNSYGDHRMAMALTLAGLIARGETLIDGAESIKVSYPGFISDIIKLGAKVEVI
ncbi:MAG: hypothetical protein APU95_01375 [Hadesarchaea archaeon YNP_N21]|nr:MAG: hypothetical protein APU95_01375 [Hadesarchaea archaeon YNP_N21]